MIIQMIVIEEKENEYLKRRFGKTFSEIVSLSDEAEQDRIDWVLWYDLENDTQDHETSLLANSILIKWGKYDFRKSFVVEKSKGQKGGSKK